MLSADNFFVSTEILTAPSAFNTTSCPVTAALSLVTDVSIDIPLPVFVTSTLTL